MNFLKILIFFLQFDALSHRSSGSSLNVGASSGVGRHGMGIGSKGSTPMGSSDNVTTGGYDRSFLHAREWEILPTLAAA